MKKQLLILPLAMILCFMVGCQDKAAMAELEEFKAQAAVEEQNKALAMRFLEASNSGDLEAVKEIFSPDYIVHQTEGQDASLEEVIESNKILMQQQKLASPDMTFVNEDTIVKGDKVVLLNTWRGTHTGDIEGLPATGNELKGRSILILRFENGKIAESWQETNVLRFMQQLGYELKPPEVKK